MLEQSETQILLKSPDGSKSISLVCNDGVAGLWLENKKTGRCVAIFVDEGTTGIGIYHDIKKAKAMSISLGMGTDGEPLIQLHNMDKTENLKILGFKDMPGDAATI